MMKAFLLATLPYFCFGQNTDLFNSRETDGRDFGPRDWDKVECDDKEVCAGYPTKWEVSQDFGWSFGTNFCRNCEPGDGCGDHHQSPIDLRREWGYNKQLNDEGFINCGKNESLVSRQMQHERFLHMSQPLQKTSHIGNVRSAAHYESNSFVKQETTIGCSTRVEPVFGNTSRRLNAATVERHALRRAQPVERVDGTCRVNFLEQGRGRLSSRLEMSGGFSRWWRLNHLEIHTPSEHTQEGRRYDAEVQLAHFYSAPAGIDNGSANRMATIGIFLEAKDDVSYLDKLICLWRYHEDQVRKNCSMASVETHYPGCMRYTRQAGEASPVRANNEARSRRKMVMDPDATDEEMVEPLHLEPDEFRPPNYTEEQWATFQEEYSKQHHVDSPNRWSNGTKTRRLIDYEHVPHFNYQFLLDVRTEYYFRYKGTTTYPPCYGRHGGTSAGNRDRTNNWRFMKDPIRIHTRQLKEMHRLLRERIAPIESIANACQVDTGARVEDDGTAWTARPIQELDETHDHWFCECDWGSKVPEDKLWCRSGDRDKEYRWWERPYGWGGESFDTNSK